MRILELNERRCQAQEHVHMLGMMNTPVDYDAKIAADARYKLAKDAWMRAEAEYQKELARLSTDALFGLSTPDDPA